MNTSVNNNNETKNAANMVASDNMKVADYLANLKKQKGESFGDLCWDNYGKASVIVFGNIAGHADELEILGGKRIEAKYSALQNGRKWTEKMGRTAAYIFNASHRDGACRYLANINNAILSAALRKEGETVKPAKSYQVGDRVNTIYGKGTIIEGEAKSSDRCRRVRLDIQTYNYGWNGMPHTFVEVSDGDMKPNHEGEDSTAYYRRAITEAAAMGCARCCEYQGKRIEVKTAYKNGHDDPTGWTYCVSWYEGKELKDCENGVTLEQAARALAQFEQDSRKNSYTPSEKLRNSESKESDAFNLPSRDEIRPSAKSEEPEPLRPAVIEPITEADKSPSWKTDLTEDDFRKLTLQHEVADEDRDIMGRRFRHAIGNKGEWLEVFISDYAGNERHALVYSYEEFMDEVRCKVRSLEYLRQFYTEDRDWQPVSA